MRKTLFFALSFFYFAAIFWGLDPQKKISQYTLNTWKSERGLPDNIILSIAQDHSGYLWLATAEGLVRFDGVNFSIFNSGNTPEFHDNYTNNLFIDSRGILWIGTLRGQLLSLERGRFCNHPLLPAAAGLSASCLAEDGQGNLWVGTSNGLFYLPPGQERRFRHYQAFPAKKILCLATDRSGRLFFSTVNKGLYRLEKKQWQPVLSAPDQLDQDVFVLHPGRSGGLWLGMESGLRNYENNSLRDYPLKNGLAANIVSLAEDRDGNLWVGSEGGLHRLSRGRIESLDMHGGLSSNYIFSLCEDMDGTLWVGTVDGGLVQLRDEKITSFSDREGLNGEMFRCLHGDPAGALWIGGYGGSLHRFLKNNFSRFILPARFRNETIWSLGTAGKDSLWLGTSLGLLRFQNGRFREMPLPSPAANRQSRCVLQDRSGRLWIGTSGAGLLCQTQRGFKRYALADGLPDMSITCLYEDRSGTLWVGSQSGLNFLAAGNGGKMNAEDSLKGFRVNSLYEDSQGNLWIGTDAHGLKIKKNGRLGSITLGQGLFDNRVYSILEDGGGCLWLSSERGIFQARKEELVRAAFDPAYKVRGRLYDESDGMKSRICNFGSPSGWKEEGGRLWFANVAGIVRIDPAHIRKNDRVPPVIVEVITVDQKNLVSPDAELAQVALLPAGSQKFAFRYTALSFIRSDKIEFKYKLEGYDREWTEAGSRREAFYTNLKPGHYRFRVRAANADGVWNMAGASFSFTLRPFIYQTWWFLALAALAFSVLSALLWQLLKKYLRAVTFWKKKTQIGHFKILETIGSGGMATVYKAQDLLDRKRIVALKVLKEENFHDENQKKRFKHESLITEQLDHPHIVRIIERGEMDECWYIAMELLQGESLALLIRRSGRLPVGTALEIMLQITDALQAIHAQDIVHRDLKPENIMVSRGQEQRYFVKLLDFGLAITPAQSRLTMSGVVMGTIRYLPPERISDGASSPAGDIYSAGIILYEMLTGSKPFWSEATGEVIHRILKTYPLPPKEISHEIPRELNALIMAMLDKDPTRRPGLDAIMAELRCLAEKFPAQD